MNPSGCISNKFSGDTGGIYCPETTFWELLLPTNHPLFLSCLLCLINSFKSFLKFSSSFTWSLVSLPTILRRYWPCGMNGKHHLHVKLFCMTSNVFGQPKSDSTTFPAPKCHTSIWNQVTTSTGKHQTSYSVYITPVWSYRDTHTILSAKNVFLSLIWLTSLLSGFSSGVTYSGKPFFSSPWPGQILLLWVLIELMNPLLCSLYHSYNSTLI